MSELIIIGNGFDLYCGLKSCYSDFYAARYTDSFIKDIENIKGNTGDFDTRNAEITLWDIVLVKCENVMEMSWKDVEDTIRNYLEYAIDDVQYTADLIKYYITLEEKFIPKKNKLVPKHIRTFRINLAKFVANSIYIDEREWYEQNENYLEINVILDVLFDELEKFEKIFRDYLYDTEEYKNKLSPYYAASKDLLKTITNYGLGYDGESKSNSKINILSFNYTTPFKENPNILIRNVHGKLDNSNIIFGIDHSYAKKQFIRFTKTYRTLRHTNTDVSSDFQKNLTAIKIFGHSLSRADYSYFESILDKIDIYNSDVKLYFFYDRYKSTESENIEIDVTQNDAVISLLSDYADSMTNLNHKNNLIHKLILENRIFIKDIGPL